MINTSDGQSHETEWDLELSRLTNPSTAQKAPPSLDELFNSWDDNASGAQPVTPTDPNGNPIRGLEKPAGALESQMGTRVALNTNKDGTKTLDIPVETGQGDDGGNAVKFNWSDYMYGMKTNQEILMNPNIPPKLGPPELTPGEAETIPGRRIVMNDTGTKSDAPMPGVSATPNSGNPDFPYDTPIGGDFSPTVGKYHQWGEEQAKVLGRNPTQDNSDYDMQGFYMAHPGIQMGKDQHFPDTFKKPNHMTFSDQSKYHGGDNQGGHWEDLGDGKWSFTPGPTNLQNHSIQEMQDYFKKYEKGNTLILPGSDSGEFKVAMNDNINKTDAPLFEAGARGGGSAGGPLRTAPPPTPANENGKLMTPIQHEYSQMYKQMNSPKAVEPRGTDLEEALKRVRSAANDPVSPLDRDIFAIENAMGIYAQGKGSPKAIHQVLQEREWTLGSKGLRGNKGELEVYDPLGNPHWLNY